MTISSSGQDEPHPAVRPAWIVPESVLPVTLTPELTLARTSELVVAIPLLRAYPAGFELELVVHVRADHGERLMWELEPTYPRPPWARTEQLFRFAVRYADGQAATNLDDRNQLAAGARGITMATSGGGTRRRGSSLRYYVQPLPPPGPMTFICEWPAYGVAETRAEIDAQDILDASNRAARLWPDPETDRARASFLRSP